MLPESMAPPLEHLDAFRAFAEERGAKVRREYTPEYPRAHGPEVREYPDEDATEEFYPSRWQVLLYREEKRSDGLIHAYCIEIPDRLLQGHWEDAWEAELELLNMGWERHLEEAGV
jgi:hypothetical protein